jgi:hypothetical protein
MQKEESLMERALPKTSLLLGFILLVCGVDIATAAEKHATVEPVLVLGSLVREATESNPEIRAARQRWEAAKAVVPQVGTLPDPKAQVGYQRMLMAEPLEGAMYGIGQEIPFPGKYAFRCDLHPSMKGKAYAMEVPAA